MLQRRRPSRRSGAAAGRPGARSAAASGLVVDRRRRSTCRTRSEQGQEQDRRKECGQAGSGAACRSGRRLRARSRSTSLRSRGATPGGHRIADRGRSSTGRHRSRAWRGRERRHPSGTITPMDALPLRAGRRSRFHAGSSSSGCRCSLLLAWALAGTLSSRALPLPDRVGDRVPAQPARARDLAGARMPPRPRRRRRVPLVRGCDDRRHRRARDGRRRAGALGRGPGRRLPYGRARTAAVRPTPSATSTASRAGSTTHGMRRSSSASRRRTGSTRSRAWRSPATRRTSISFALGAAFGVRPAALLARPDRRHLGLHAARHAEARSGRSTGASRRTAVTAADAADRVGARRLRARADPALDDHRRERGHRHVAARGARPRPGRRAATRSSSGSGRPWSR